MAEKKTRKVEAMTLRDVFKDYLKIRKDLKPRTRYDYEKVLGEVVSDWLGKPLVSITREMISKRHLQHGASNSKARANNAMRVLRALFNFAMNQYYTSDGQSIITMNPIKYLGHTKAWYRVDRKQTVIKSHQLADWYQGVIRLVEQDNYRNALLWHDYFLLLLFTGMRKMEAASLRWEDVDLKLRTITLQGTKNHEIHTLPMPDFIYELMERRSRDKTSKYVFSANSKT